jgi:RNA polymerase sigma-70 factor (ECF subfamily)
MDDCGSAPNLTDLARQHYALVYRYAYRLCRSAEEAEDLTQQAFLTAHRRLEQLRDANSAKSWLCAILRNTFLTRVAAQRGHKMVSLHGFWDPVQEQGTDTKFDSNELQQVLNELPEEFRTPLILYYFEEFSYRQIAEQMDVPIGTVMSRLARAKTHLRRRLEALQSTPTR